MKGEIFGFFYLILHVGGGMGVCSAVIMMEK